MDRNEDVRQNDCNIPVAVEQADVSTIKSVKRKHKSNQQQYSSAVVVWRKNVGNQRNRRQSAAFKKTLKASIIFFQHSITR